MITMLGVASIVLAWWLDEYCDHRWYRFVRPLVGFGLLCLVVSVSILCARYLP